MNKQAMARSYHVAQGNLSSIQLLFPNWYGAELSPGSTATITAGIEYPVGTFTQVMFSGVAAGTIPDGGTLLSDPCLVQIPDGAAFYVRSYVTSAAGILFTNFVNSATFGEAFNFGASGITDRTMGGAIAGASNLYGPLAILGTTTRPTILVLGDSRAAGNGETAPVAGTTETGQVTRSLFPSIGFINASLSGERASLVLATNAKRRALAQYCSHIICELGINDIRGGRTSAQLFADLLALRSLFGDKPWFQTTLLPASTSTDAWATTGNQSVEATNAARVTFNNLIRTIPSPFSGCLENADAVESARDSGIWKAPGFTADGLHPTATGYAAIQTAGTIVPAQFFR